MNRCNICGSYLKQGVCTNCTCPEYFLGALQQLEKEAEAEADRQRFMNEHGLGDRDMINDNKPTDI